jgi:hypothetical protein
MEEAFMRSPGGVEKLLPDVTVVQVLTVFGETGQSEEQNPPSMSSPSIYGMHQIMCDFPVLERQGM